MSASVADILRQAGFVPVGPVACRTTGTAQTQAPRVVPVVPVVPAPTSKVETAKLPTIPEPSRIVCDVRLSDHPGSWFVLLGRPGQRFDLIRQELQVQYAGRLLDVRQHAAARTS